MLDYAYSTYRMKKYISKNKVVKRINNSKIKSKKIEIVPSHDINILIKTNENIKPSYSIKINNLKTNIKKGDKVGVITIKNKGKVINRVNLTVNRDIKKANIIELYFKYLKDILSGNMGL